MLAAGNRQAHCHNLTASGAAITSTHQRPIGIGENWCELAERWLRWRKTTWTSLIAVYQHRARRNGQIAAATSQTCCWPAPSHMTCARFRRVCRHRWVDVQDDRLEIQITGWGRHDAVDTRLPRPARRPERRSSQDVGWRNTQRSCIRKSAAQTLRISFTGIDTGGYHTVNTVYARSAAAPSSAPYRLQGRQYAGRIILGKPSADVPVRPDLKRRVAASGRHRHRQGAALWQTARRHRDKPGKRAHSEKRQRPMHLLKPTTPAGNGNMEPLSLAASHHPGALPAAENRLGTAAQPCSSQTRPQHQSPENWPAETIKESATQPARLAEQRRPQSGGFASSEWMERL